ncbi:LacI family DNA-binding transcriptional regulator [Gymnodinialimonas hymeniacidonis]|uniref:LacI family DNA-binding transcriptional regulator n=1 Tax=Gymnodinialimonas hymeniacidonis TaxID=3126508 RepID=UPI0034C5F2F2
MSDQPTQKKRPTVKDVAREAGLSIATVSRALSRPETVKKDTRAHVYEVVKRIGYRANKAASDLRRGHSKTLLVLVSDITNAFFAEFFKGIEEEARSRGYVLLIGDTSEDAESERVFSDMLLMNQAGGLILNTYGFPSDLYPPDGGNVYSGPPIVSCSGRREFDLPTVQIDDVSGGRQVGEHLINLGHRNMIQLCGPLQIYGFERRFFGFCQALKAAGIPLQNDRNFVGEMSTDFGIRVAAQIAEMEDRPTAIFVHNDETAIGLLHGLSKAGIRVPEDISVVGYDDMPYSAVFNPGLTTVHLPRRKWGQMACAKLIELLEGEDPDADKRRVITPELIARASSRALI